MITVFGLPESKRLISVSHDSELRSEWRDILYIRLVAMKAVMDAMAHKNFMAIAALPAPGDQRFQAEEHNRIFKAQESRGKTLTEIKKFKAAVYVGEWGRVRGGGGTHRPREDAASEKT